MNICRFILGATFVFSGFVKAVDPLGTYYKIQDYLTAFGMQQLLPDIVPLILSVLLATIEFGVGVHLLLGIKRRATTRLALLIMLVMTPLTFYLALTNPISDCGCFGDALVLTNWQTFGKNVVLLVAAIVVVKYYRKLTRFITERNQWLLSLYALVFALFLAIYNIRHLPVIDFRPYYVGVDLPKAIEAEWERGDGEMQYLDFGFQSLEGEDITFDWIGQQGYKFLLVTPWLEQADDGPMDKINALYDYCQEHGYPFLALTSSLPESIDRWKDLTGAEYDFALADGTMLKTIIRSNPGLLLMRDGVIYQKWAASDIPNVVDLTTPLEENRLGQMQVHSRIQTIWKLFLWFFLPILLWTLIDRIWVGHTFYERYKIHRHIEH